MRAMLLKFRPNDLGAWFMAWGAGFVDGLVLVGVLYWFGYVR